MFNGLTFIALQWGAYKDQPEIWVTILSPYFNSYKTPKSVARPILARPLMEKNVFWPVLKLGYSIFHLKANYANN